MAKIAGQVAMTAGLAAAGVALGAVTMGGAFLAVGATVVSAGLSSALTPKAETGAISPEVAEPAAANANRITGVSVRQAVPPRQIVYGNCRTAGSYFFLDNSNPNLYIGTAISDGRIESIDAVLFGDTAVPLAADGSAATGTRYANNFRLEKSLGTAAQTASALLLSAFPSLGSSFRQQGVARAVAKLGWGADATANGAMWGDGTSPNYLIKGVCVYDPRDVTQSVSDNTTWKYSDNPALCIAHAMTNVWDTALPATRINWPSVVTAANVCDATVIVGGTARKMFTLAGVFQSGHEVAGQISAMLAAMDGSVTFSDGLYSIHAGGTKTSVWTIADFDVLEIGEVRHGVETADMFGSIDAEYYSADEAGRATTTPVYTLGAGRKTSLSLLFSAASHSAQILAYRALQNSRAPVSFTLTVSDAGAWLTPGVDAITIAFQAAPYLNGIYSVDQVDLVNGGVSIKLRSYVSAAYADPTGYLQ